MERDSASPTASWKKVMILAKANDVPHAPEAAAPFPADEMFGAQYILRRQLHQRSHTLKIDSQTHCRKIPRTTAHANPCASMFALSD